MEKNVFLLSYHTPPVFILMNFNHFNLPTLSMLFVIRVRVTIQMELSFDEAL